MRNISNYISISRIIISIALLITKIFSNMFYILYILCGISDMLDGYLARKLNIASEKGAKLDSIADAIFVLVCAIKILPILKISKIIAIWCVIIFIMKVINIISGYIRYKKIIFLHTNANKITGILLFAFPLIINCIDALILEIFLCFIATISAIQEKMLLFSGVFELGTKGT